MVWSAAVALFADGNCFLNFEILLQKWRVQIFEIKLQSKIYFGLSPCVVLKLPLIGEPSARYLKRARPGINAVKSDPTVTDMPFQP